MSAQPSNLSVQIGADGRRSQIFLAMSTATEFRDHLSSFSEFYSSLGPPNPENVPEDGKLKSEMMLKVTIEVFFIEDA